MIPVGVHGSGAGLPSTSQPRFVGCRPSTSLSRVDAHEQVVVDSAAQAGRLLDEERGARRVGVELVDDGLDLGLGRALPAGRGGCWRCRSRRSPCAWR